MINDTIKRSPQQPFTDEDDLIVFAHRGERGRYPENTMLSFEKAARHDIDALEMDFHYTADGVPVVIHDDTVDRTTNGKGPVNSYLLQEIKALDAGYWWSNNDGRTYPFRGQGITIPTLEEVFTAFPDLWINLDIKQHDAEAIPPFVALLHRHDMVDHVMVGSGDSETVYRFREACPEAATVASRKEALRLFLSGKIGVDRLYWGEADAVQIPEYYKGVRVVTPGFVEAAHRNGVAVHVWTVNDRSDMERLIDLGVDGLMTDYPARLLRLIGRKDGSSGEEDERK